MCVFACRVSEVTEPVCALDNRGVAIGCFVLGRCLQLGQAVSKDQEKAHHYYTKVTSITAHSRSVCSMPLCVCRLLDWINVSWLNCMTSSHTAKCSCFLNFVLFCISAHHYLLQLDENVLDLCLLFLITPNLLSNSTSTRRSVAS